MPSNPTPDEMRLALAQENRVPVPNRPGRTIPAEMANPMYALTHGLAPMLYGAAKGTVASVPGVVGDINELLRDYVRPYLPTSVQGALAKAPAPYTTEQYVNMMPKMGGHTEDVATKLGANVVGAMVDPFAVAGAIKRAPAAGRALAETAHNKILAGESLIPGMPAQFINPPVLSAVKPKGGNWLSRPIDWNVDKFKKDATGRPLEDASLYNYTPEMNPNVEAMNSWIDKKLKPYIRNEFATPDDPIRKLADEGIKHVDLPTTHGEYRIAEKRQAEGMPATGYANTPAGIEWERLADKSVSPTTVDTILRDFNPELSRMDPWLNKLHEKDPNSKVNILSSDTFDRLGFDHIIDVLSEQLARGDISAADLAKVSMKDAVARTHKYDQELAETKRVKTLEDQANMTSVKEYKEGDKWVKLDKPGQFAAESDAMGHSVRGYEPHKDDTDWIKESGNSGRESYGLGGWNAIKEGTANVFSLRNPKGESKATIEARKNIDTDYRPERLPSDISEQFRLASEKEAVEAGYRPGSEPFLNYVTGGEIQKRSKWFRENPEETYQITQIKGPNNGEIDPDHAWQVVDFLNTHPVGEVNFNDLEKAYVTDTKSKRHMREFIDENYGGNLGMVDSRQILEHLESNYPNMPRFIHNMELGNMIEEAPAFRSPEGYKDGGGVSAVESGDPSMQFYSRTMDNPDNSKTTEQGIVKQFEQDYMRFALQRHEQPKRQDIPNPPARTNVYGEYGTPAMGGMVSGRLTKMNDQPDAYMGDLAYRTNIGPGMAHVGVQGMRTPQMPAQVTNYNAGYNVPLGNNGFAGVNVMQPAQGGKPVLGAQFQYRRPFAKGGAVTSLENNLPKLQNTDYKSIDELMTEISKRHKTAPKKLHDDFVEKHRMTPDNWIKRK